MFYLYIWKISKIYWLVKLFISGCSNLNLLRFLSLISLRILLLVSRYFYLIILSLFFYRKCLSLLLILCPYILDDALFPPFLFIKPSILISFSVSWNSFKISISLLGLFFSQILSKFSFELIFSFKFSSESFLLLLTISNLNLKY